MVKFSIYLVKFSIYLVNLHLAVSAVKICLMSENSIC